MASSFPFPLPQVHRSPKRDKRNPPPCACLLLNLYYTLEKPHWTRDALPRELQVGFSGNLLPPLHFWEPLLSLQLSDCEAAEQGYREGEPGTG